MSAIDPASMPEASYEHHPVEHLEPVDNPASLLAGLLHDEICKRRVSRDVKQVLHDCVEDAVREAMRIGLESATEDSLRPVTEILWAFTEAPTKDARLLAYCYLLVINRCPYSEVAIAKRLRCTKAAVSKWKVRVQDRFGLHPRVGRSEKARETFRQIRLQGRERKAVDETLRWMRYTARLDTVISTIKNGQRSLLKHWCLETAKRL